MLNKPPDRLTRREVVQTLLGMLGGALAWPAIGAAHPVHRHLSDDATLAKADASVAAANWSPTFFNPHQNETFILLAERIVPGATNVRTNRVVDLLLTVDTADNREKFVASLRSVDDESQKRFQKPFKDLGASQQDEVLRIFASGETGEVESGSHDSATNAADDPDDERPGRANIALRDHFENLKGWVVGTYYTSEVGMRELGWTGDFYFDHVPGCQHSEEH